MPSLRVSAEIQAEIDRQIDSGEPHERLDGFQIVGLFARRKKDVDRNCPECVEGRTIAKGNVPEGLPCARCNETGVLGGAQAACLRHRGLDAIAVARVSNERELAVAEAHGTITVDEYRWSQLTERERRAVIDHELTHFEIVEEGLKIRQHDFEVGWFHAVAQRHGESSQERIQARRLLASDVGQLYFPGMEPEPETFSEAHDKGLSRAADRILRGESTLAEESGEVPRRKRPRISSPRSIEIEVLT